MSEVFDFAGSMERMGQDEQLFGEMVGFLFADVPLWLAQARQSLDAGDAVRVHRSAHTVKGLVANFGAYRAIHAAAQVEELAKAGDLEAAGRIMPQLEAAYQELHEALAPYHRPVDELK